ncbi:MAG: hypothetical protein V3S14_13820 [Anaerolineae bacterium]
MDKLIKKWIPTLLFTIIPGLIVLLGYLIPENQVLAGFRDYLVKWAVIMAAFAFLLGIFNILRVHSKQLLRRQQGWYYSLALLFAMLAAGLAPILQMILKGRLDSPAPAKMLDDATSFVFNYIISPSGASLAALMTFTLTLAAFRLLRTRRSPVTVFFLMVVAVALLGTTPFVGLEQLAEIRDWIINVPGMAGMRGLLLGVALGTVVTGLRVFLAIEVP